MGNPIDRKVFFAEIHHHPFGGPLTPAQVDGITRILDEWERRKLTLLAWLAYMLATVFHETWREMQPIREKGSDSYLRAKPYWPWIGEGLVQVTWADNARKFGAQKPGDCLTWPVALRALFDGMINGVFTGRGLSHYFTARLSDPINARRIINSLDQAQLIASYFYAFLHALSLAAHPALPITVADKPVPLKAAA